MFPPDHEVLPSIVKKNDVVWGVDLSGPFAAPPEYLFDAWLDGKKFAEITGKPAKGSATVGAPRAMFGAFAKGSVVELERPRRIVERWRSKHFPKDAPDSVFQIFFEPHPKGTMMHFKQWGFVRPPTRPLDYETMMFWQSKVFGLLRQHLESRNDAPAHKAAPPSGAEKERLVALLAKEDLALGEWTSSFATFGEPVLLRMCIGAARAALPVWTAAEKAKPRSKDFRDVVAGFKTEGGAPPAKVIAALCDYLDEPSAKNLNAAIATLDPTAQLRFTDEDMGDLSNMPWAYALEAARCGAYGLQKGAVLAKETAIAVESATKALGGTKKSEADVRTSIRKELEEWLAS
jgi:uncharacterized protein YndB with AHSA1/START domain